MMVTVAATDADMWANGGVAVAVILALAAMVKIAVIPLFDRAIKTGEQQAIAAKACETSALACERAAKSSNQAAERADHAARVIQRVLGGKVVLPEIPPPASEKAE